MTFAEHLDSNSITLIERYGDLRARKMSRNMLPMTLTAYVDTGIARADVQRAIVSIANLIYDKKPQPTGLITGKVLAQRVEYRLSMGPFCGIVARGKTLLDPDAKIPEFKFCAVKITKNSLN